MEVQDVANMVSNVLIEKFGYAAEVLLTPTKEM
jgi:hypothetical protein